MRATWTAAAAPPPPGEMIALAVATGLVSSGEAALDAKPMLEEFATEGRAELTVDEFVRGWVQGGRGPVKLEVS